MAEFKFPGFDGTNTVAGLISNPSSIQAQFTDVVGLAQTEANNLRNYAQRAAGDFTSEFEQATTNLFKSSDDPELAVRESILSAFDNESKLSSLSSSAFSNTDPGRNSNSSTKTNYLPNVLHNYVTNSYNLSLHAMTRDEYNNLMLNGVGDYKANHVLIASSGRRGSETGLIRHPLWQDDFYFDKMTMDAVIGVNNKGRGSNVLTIDFTIVEPYGITFLDRLAQTAEDLGWQSPLELICLIQVDFSGYKDSDLSPTKIDQTTRRIPVRLVKVDVSYNQNGSNYAVQAIPVNHSAFDDENMRVQTPVRIGQSPGNDLKLASMLATTEEGKAKVKAQLSSYQNQRTEVLQRRSRQLQFNNLDPGAAQIAQSEDEYVESSGVRLPEVNATGLGSILNGYWEWVAEVTNLKTPPYVFEILLKDGVDIKFQDIKLLDQAITNLRNKQTAKRKDKTLAAQAQQNDTKFPAGGALDVMFPVSTSIVEIINQLLKCTNYFLDQVRDKGKHKVSAQDDRTQSEVETGSAESSPVNFFKITPTIKLGPYIKEKKDYQKIVTLAISPYKYYGNRLPFGGRGDPKKSNCVKEYNYLFTGKNTDILDVKIDFNYTFYSFVTVNAYRYQEEKDQGAQKKDYQAEKEEEYLTPYQRSLLGGKMLTAPVLPNSIDPNQTNDLTLRVNDLFNNIYSASKADMLNVDLKIIGDPHFIQEQEALFDYRDKGRSKADPRLTTTGSLMVNDGDLLVNLIFKLTNDIDTTTGLYRYSDKDLGLKNRFYSGIYRITTIKNEFEKGQFTQNLSLVRLYNDENAKQSGAKTANPRDTENSVAQFTDLAEIEHQFQQVGGTDTNGPTMIPDFESAFALAPQAQQFIPSVTGSVTQAQTLLQNQATDKIREIRRELAVQTQPLLTLDGTEAFDGLPGAGVVNSTEARRILSSINRNAGDEG